MMILAIAITVIIELCCFSMLIVPPWTNKRTNSRDQYLEAYWYWMDQWDL